MAVQNGLAEYFEKVGKIIKNADKIAALRAQDTIQVRTILQGAYDPTVSWLLPPGEVPYTPTKLVDQEHVLINEIQHNKIRYYIKGFYDTLPAIKRETMFVELLERVAPKDAELLIAIKDKKPLKGITLNLVKEAFPGMIQESSFPKNNSKDNNDTTEEVNAEA